MNNSLQRRLSVWLCLVVVTTGLLATVVSFVVAYEDAKEFQDHMLRQIALLAAGNPGISMPIEIPKSNSKRAAEDNATRITVIRIPEDQRPDWLDGNLKKGFHTIEKGQKHIRVFILEEMEGRATAVAQPTKTRDELALNSALLALTPLLFVLPVMVWLILRIVRNQLAPVGRLAGHLDAQPANRPLALSETGVPDEIVPFVQAINRLLQRVSDLMNQQRRFIADAAHELRSPLTALSIQAQNLMLSPNLDVMHERVIPLQAGIERSRKLTEQLLSLARTQADTQEASDVDVSAMARELIAEFLPWAQEKRIDLGLDEVEQLTLKVAPEALRLVLRNALENALKYAPEGGEVTLRLYTNANGKCIDIVDDGPGIANVEQERVFDPFYRIPGAAGEGSGLGLSIAREAAVSQGGCVSLLNRPEGPGLIFHYQHNR